MLLLLVWLAGLTGIASLCQHRALLVGDYPVNSFDSLVIADTVALADASPAFDQELPVVYYLRSFGDTYAVMSFDYKTRRREAIAEGSGFASALRIDPGDSALSITTVDARGNSLLIRISKHGKPIETRSLPGQVTNFMWIDDNNLILVEDGKPNSLSLMTLRPARKVSIARHVGKSLANSRKTTSFAFVHKLAIDSWSIKEIHRDGGISILAETLPEADVFAFTGEGIPVLYHDGGLYRYVGKNGWTIFCKTPVGSSVNFIEFSPSLSKIALLTEQHHDKSGHGQ